MRVGEWTVQELKEEKWLGDQMCGGLSRAVMATIQARAGQIGRASYEIVNIVKDCRAQRLGGFTTAILLWESCAIPSLLYNCSTWVGIGGGLSRNSRLLHAFSPGGKTRSTKIIT